MTIINWNKKRILMFICFRRTTKQTKKEKLIESFPFHLISFNSTMDPIVIQLDQSNLDIDT